MEQLGTMFDGIIVPDEPSRIPNGTRIVFERVEELDDVPYSFHETEEQIIASIRESIAETKAGVPGIPLEEIAAELKRDFGVPATSEK